MSDSEDPRIRAAANAIWAGLRVRHSEAECKRLAIQALAAADRAAWQPISEAQRGKTIIRWHVMWEGPVAVKYDEQFGADMPWIEQTKTTRWPEDAFSPHFQRLPAPPPSEDET